MAKILILKGDVSNDLSEGYKTYEGLRKVGLDDYFIAEYNQVIFEINNLNYTVYYYSSSGEKIDLCHFDLVYIRDFQGYEYERNCIAQYLKYKKVKFINYDVSEFQNISKLTQYAQFFINSLPIPDSLYIHKNNIENIDYSKYEFPFIVKSIVANTGKDNYLVENVSDLKRALSKGKMIIQKFIPNTFDYRLIVMGDNVGFVAKRQRTNPDDHRNNIGVGSKKTIVDLSDVPEGIKLLAIQSSKALNRQLSGVDIMTNSVTGENVVLEVNYNFGIASLQAVPQEISSIASYLHKIAN